MASRRSFLIAGFSALATRAFADPVADHQRAAAAARIAQARADVLLRGLGMRTSSVAERLRALAKDDRWLFPDTDAGRERAVAEMNARLAKLRPRLVIAFGALTIPAAEVRRMSPADVAAGRGGYREPGAYYVDLRDIRARPAWTLPSVAFHETVPGHALGPPAGTPMFEGWATYAEQLAADLGAYAGDPRGELGYLQWRLFRLGRVVADTGLSTMGWSRDRAIAEMMGLQGQSIAFITIEADVDRMIKAPGKVAAEGIAALEIAARRPKDRRAWPAYHRMVLGA